MTDYFALLQQPRKPWLDAEQLKQKYHELARGKHPELAILNEAYRVLADPKLRLHHLLSLERAPPSTTGESVPDHLANLFIEIGALVTDVDLVLAKATAADSALSKSLLKASTLEQQKRLQDLLTRVRDLYDSALNDLRSIDQPQENLPQIENAYHRLAYLTRWKDLLEERNFRLSI
jgi:curved DNA-binding protein CbpA